MGRTSLNDVPDDQGGPAMPTDRSETTRLDIVTVLRNWIGDGPFNVIAVATVRDAIEAIEHRDRYIAQQRQIIRFSMALISTSPAVRQLMGENEQMKRALERSAAKVQRLRDEARRERAKKAWQIVQTRRWRSECKELRRALHVLAGKAMDDEDYPPVHVFTVTAADIASIGNLPKVNPVHVPMPETEDL